jgi:hypothetical protein
MRMSRFAVLAALLWPPVANPAHAADLPARVEITQPIAAADPCGDPHVLERIMERFAWAEAHAWRGDIVMASLGNGRQSGHPYAEPGIIKRDYCMADARMSDQKPFTVFFTIEYGQGFASIGNYVDFCVLGLDPWRVHDEACRTVR